VEIEKGLPPEFVSITVCEAEVLATSCAPNVRATGLKETKGPAPAEPVPFRVTVESAAELLSELVASAAEPAMAPTCTGAKLTAVLQSEPGANTVPGAQSDKPVVTC